MTAHGPYLSLSIIVLSLLLDRWSVGDRDSSVHGGRDNRFAQRGAAPHPSAAQRQRRVVPVFVADGVGAGGAPLDAGVLPAVLLDEDLYSAARTIDVPHQTDISAASRRAMLS